MKKIFDLNNRDGCISAAITLSDKTFTIKRVVIAVRALYSNYIKTLGILLQDISNIDEENAALVSEDVNKFSIEKESIFDEILNLILKANGYEYDKDWWSMNASDEDMRYFIETCLNKDNQEIKKK